MRERVGRIQAIIVADGRERLRRPSTAVLFLAMCFLVYLWVPDPATGRALMVVDGQRVVYNSPAIALATAVLGTFMLGLFGYYVVSRSISRDAARTGAVIAATPMANWEYLVGKALGNLAFLALLAAGYMASSMAMQLVRSAEPLEPLAYIVHYLYLLPPALLFTSVTALLFESVPWLAGKLGDVLYFFLWMTLLGLATALSIGPGGGSPLLLALDMTGLADVMGQLKSVVGTTSLSIGSSSFDAGRGLFLFEGIAFDRAGLLHRGVALAAPLPMFLLAWWRFHRFDPARVRLGGGRAPGRGFLRSLEGLVRPWVATPARRLLGGVGRRPGLLGAVVADAALTLIRNPLGGLALVVALVAGCVVPLPALLRGWLPPVFAAMALLVAGAAAREPSHGTQALVYASPLLRPWLVAWKLAAALALCLLFVAPAAARLGLDDPQRAATLLTGACFVAAAATSLDVLTASPKAFVILFLSFWYLVLNDRGSHPGLDFAGFYGTATPATAAVYLALAALLLAAALAVHRRRAAA